MPLGGGLTAGVVGASVGGSLISSGKQADAAQGIASSQQGAADRNRAAALGFAQPTSSELDQLIRQNGVAMQAVNYQQARLAQTAAQFAAIDPTIKAAFEQQGQILQGKIPDYLSPLQKQLQIAQQQNMSRINATLGTGASSSSAGAMAEAQFGQQNAMTLMGAQQQALATLGQVGSNGVAASSQLNADNLNAFGSASNANQAGFNMSNALQSRQINASLGTNVTPYAGGQYAGQLMGAQTMGNMFNTVGGIGSAIALSKAFGPTAQQQTYQPTSTGFGAQNPQLTSPWSLGVGH